MGEVLWVPGVWLGVSGVLIGLSHGSADMARNKCLIPESVECVRFSVWLRDSPSMLWPAWVVANCVLLAKNIIYNIVTIFSFRDLEKAK